MRSVPQLTNPHCIGDRLLDKIHVCIYISRTNHYQLLLKQLIYFSSDRLEGEGEFTDTESQQWTGIFRYKAALGLLFKLNME